LGGAITKNKLYYFVNFETEQRSDAPTSYVAQNAENAGKTNTSRVLQQDLDAVRSILKSRFNYETGDYQGFNLNKKAISGSPKLIGSLITTIPYHLPTMDWMLQRKSPRIRVLSVVRGPDFTTLQFRNSGYRSTINYNLLVPS
jgi:hypothetical protein